jgi:23S rRNA U2552 (ribose-2'-O)-methylase RlmE/FtsJ
MIYFLLPHNYSHLYQYIDYIRGNPDQDNPCISQSLYFYLFEIKEKMNLFQYDWDVYKKYTNPYEYIHTMCPIKKKCVSKHKPLSRSYFKFIELYYSFHLDEYPAFIESSISTFHLAEGPGGFIEALILLRGNKCSDTYIGMTLQDSDDDHNIPAWKKTQNFLKQHPNIIIENGITGTGDILSLDNFVYCCEKYKSSMTMITGDGGFDFSENFNDQEKNIGNLLFAQIAYAVCMQKRGGTFILKIFDFFMSHTIDLLYLLSSFYEKVYITKPDTSRYANSEKYLVCIGFIPLSSDAFYPYFLKAFQKMVQGLAFGEQVVHFLNKPISYYFTMKLEEYNSTFGQQQIENIYATISLIENKDFKNKNNKINELNKINIQKCVNWCMKFGLPYQ